MSMKRVFLLFLILIICIGLVSCARDQSDNSVFQEDLKDIIQRIEDGTAADLPQTEYKDINEENVEYYLGLSNLDDIKEAVVSEALISTIPYSFCVLRVNDISTVEDLKENIKNNINLSKWICVRADCVYINNYNDFVMVVMGEKSVAKAVYNFFEELTDGDMGKLQYKEID